jgi:prepilin-type N-terminal cleavage/methylation domain-containing protein
MNDAGYTLTEMLAALAMIGLAMGGLSAGLAVLGRIQAEDAQGVADLNAVRAARVGVETVLDGQGPFRSRDTPGLKGDAGGFRFPCEAGATCEVRLAPDTKGRSRVEVTDARAATRRFRIPGPSPLTLSYVGGRGPSPVWPPEDVERQTLRAVVLRRATPSRGAPSDVFQARVWREQAGDCAFDVLMQDCR